MRCCHRKTVRNYCVHLLLISLLLAAAAPMASNAFEFDKSAQSGASSSRSASAVVISEVLPSASSASYNGTDWNGDGDIGSESDQFIELHNTGTEAINIGGWWLDDIDHESSSSACQIGEGTTLQADERLPFFRARTKIVLDYWTGDTVRLLDANLNPIDSFSYPEEDSRFDVPYVRQSDGTLQPSGSPTPGWAPGEAAQQASPGGTCYPPIDYVHRGAYALSGRLVTMDSAGVIEDGGIMIVDGMIAAVWDNGAGQTAPNTVVVNGVSVDVSNVEVLDTSGTIYPGLIDMHNHMHYNYLPLWNYELENGEFYTNRYQWKDNPGYKPEVTWAKNFIQQSNYWNLEPQSLKYAEMKLLAGGTTAVQGNPTHDREEYATILARNIEHDNFGRDYMHTKVSELTDTYQGNHIKSGNESGTLDAWFLHLAEGTDSSSLYEFDILLENDLLVGEVIVIHGVPLGPEEFGAMANVGASLAWSPTSNMLLYGDTADVAAAKAAGVKISLAPDWAPSGSKSPLHELKTADWWNNNKLDGVFSSRELVEMVTINPVDSMNWDDETGRLREGLAADIVVIDSFHDDPYRNLIEAIDPDLRLTIAAGLPIIGDVDLMSALNGDDYEIAQGDGFVKALDVTFRGVPFGEESWSGIESRLRSAMQFNRDEMYDNFTYANSMTRSAFDDWIGGTYGALDAIPLDPIFTYGDDRYFSSLNGSQPFNSQGNIDLWTIYYAIELDEGGHRIGSGAPGYNGTGGGGGGSGTTGGGGGSSGGGSSGGGSDGGSGSSGGTDGGTGDNDDAIPEWNDDPVSIPTLLPTYGPLGMDSWAHNSSISAGIHLEVCNTNETHADGRVRACGAIVILTDPASGCFIENTSTGLTWQEPCPSRAGWAELQQSVSEEAANGTWAVSRLNPARGSGSTIAFPGRMCADSVVVTPLIPADPANGSSEGNGIRIDDVRSGTWVCRQASKWVVAPTSDGTGDDGTGGIQTGAEDVESQSWLNSNLYYAILIAALFVIILSFSAIMMMMIRRR